MRGVPLAVLVSLLGLSQVGCLSDIGPDTCDRSADGNPPVRYEQGTAQDGVYMTSSWDGELLYFPGGMRYELAHHLGETPRFWQAYLSFNRYGTKNVAETPGDDERGTLALASGNQAELVGATEETLTLVNGSCSDYWLLVVASLGDAPQGP